MKKLIFLMVALMAVSGVAGCGSIAVLKKPPGDHWRGYYDGMEIKEGYSAAWSSHYNKVSKKWYSAEGKEELCDKDQMKKPVYISRCRQDICGWYGLKKNYDCEKYCSDWAEHVLRTQNNKICGTHYETKTTLARFIKGKGWERDIEEDKNISGLCTGEISISDYVASWERTHPGVKCKEDGRDCIERGYQQCGHIPTVKAWHDSREGEYREKKIALCTGKINSEAWKPWFEWNICKEYKKILAEVGLKRYGFYAEALVEVPCSVLSEIYLKAERESCGRQ